MRPHFLAFRRVLPGGMICLVSLAVAEDGQVRGLLARPATLPDSNNEGIALAPESECAGGLKSFFWADDSNFGGRALRRGSVACGTIL